MKGRIADAAQAALETIWDGDVPAEFPAAGGPVGIQAGIGVVEFELPGAIEAQPALALELGLRILRPRDGGRVEGGTSEKDRRYFPHMKLYCNRADAAGRKACPLVLKFDAAILLSRSESSGMIDS